MLQSLISFNYILLYTSLKEHSYNSESLKKSMIKLNTCSFVKN
ncbi:hypothetical protein A1OE_1105 [Candidatus Endolissoclinum faulkneri L2]|uniref:Uncharacterized protein n=1 Tax=Candidatus Endolissoclinum faulkneri L2 TaxID=1193729 RepID=K7Z5F7_9PROT|nr:hypothetical protein A1OE_1105 [Candidatus Endolissoclinum faulkneri L2]